MKNVIIVDNQDLKVDKNIIMGTTISTNVTPKKAFKDWTKEDQKKYGYLR